MPNGPVSPGAAPPPSTPPTAAPAPQEGRFKKLIRRFNETYAGLTSIGAFAVICFTAGIYVKDQIDTIKTDESAEHTRLDGEITEIRKYIEGNQAVEFHEFNSLCLKEGHRIDYNNKSCINDQTGEVTQFEYYQPATAAAPAPAKAVQPKAAPNAKHP
jgi:hypothetical protein